VIMKLFMFQIGGNYGGANVELHDVRFSIGNTIQDCYDDLREQWWGDPKSLHLDCWGEVAQVDGFDIRILPRSKSVSENKLFFLNLGGYDPAEFGELHKNMLLVMPDIASAKKRALLEVKHWSQPHKDKNFEVEKTLNLSKDIRKKGYSIDLSMSSDFIPFAFSCKYLKIGR